MKPARAACGRLAALCRGAAVPDGRARARPRRPHRPADPAVDVRVGGGDRPDRLVRRARRAVAADRGCRSRALRRAADDPARRATLLRARRRRALRRSSSTRRSPARRCRPRTSRRPSIYVAFWVGIPVLSVLFGDVFALFSPWRAIATAGSPGPPRGVAARASTPSRSRTRRWLGRWPAALGILGVRLGRAGLRRNRDDPVDARDPRARLRASCSSSAWRLRRSTRGASAADAFGVYFNLFARLSVLDARERRAVRAPAAVRAAAARAVAGDGRAARACDRHDDLRRRLERRRCGSTRAAAAGSFFADLGARSRVASELASTRRARGRDRVLIVGSSTGWGSAACATRRRGPRRARAGARVRAHARSRSRSPTRSRTTSRCSSSRARR